MPWMKDGQELTALPPTVRVGDYNVPTASLNGPALEALGYCWVEPTPYEPTPEEALAAAVEEIEAAYATRFAALNAALLNVLWADGPEEAVGRAALAAQRAELLEAMELEIATLFMEG